MEKLLLIVALLTLCSLTALARDYHAEFSEWAVKHNKKYTAAERAKRFTTWKKTLEWVEEWNAAGHSSRAGMNQFSDLDQGEMSRTHTTLSVGNIFGDIPHVQLPPTTSKQQRALPDAFDWRSYGAVTSVKDQLYCGACWAFTTAATIESRMVIENKGTNTTDLSEQQLVDCTANYDGCEGGYQIMGYAQASLQYGGIENELDYPWTSGSTGTWTGKCKKKKTKAVAWVSIVLQSTVGSEVALQTALYAYGPVSVAIDGNTTAFKQYSSGVFTGSCSSMSSSANHAVTIIGWGKSGTTSYFIAKNSWGTSWGIDGYMWMQMGSNICGITNNALLPILCNGTEADCGTYFGSDFGGAPGASLAYALVLFVVAAVTLV